MYYGLLRVSEIASHHPVLARDVHIGQNERKFLLILRTSKMHWKNMKPQMIKISAMRNSSQSKSHKLVVTQNDYYPYKLLRTYANIRGDFKTDSEPFFVQSDHSPVTPRQINTVRKTTIRELGFDSSLYSSHGLRSGRTSDLAKLGLSMESIKKLGRWRSNAVYTYLRY